MWKQAQLNTSHPRHFHPRRLSNYHHRVRLTWPLSVSQPASRSRFQTLPRSYPAKWRREPRLVGRGLFGFGGDGAGNLADVEGKGVVGSEGHADEEVVWGEGESEVVGGRKREMGKEG
jgi:hypothetical protein